MVQEYSPCSISAKASLRSRLSLKSLKLLSGWQERWMVLQGELLTAYESEAVTPTISSWSFSRCHLVLIFHILMVFMMVIVTAFRMYNRR